MSKCILVTGSAGFIGYHLVQRLLNEGYSVVGVDNLNDYYDPSLKISRLLMSGIDINRSVNRNDCIVSSNPNYQFKVLDITRKDSLNILFENFHFEYVIHLAAQAGVRYCVTNPHAYIDSNIVGFINVLESCRNYKIRHLIYASSSSVYGLNDNAPFIESGSSNHPASLYAATKKANEMMAHSYSHMYGLPTTGLRFFTVYGPWGRPDMALSLFTEAIFNDKPIRVFNNGQLIRDFTYIDDIIEGILRLMILPPSIDLNWNSKLPDPSYSSAPFRILNIGNSNPISLLDYIREIELAIGKIANKEFCPMQVGDVKCTHANIEKIISITGFSPRTDIRKGIKLFIDWYREYYNFK